MDSSPPPNETGAAPAPRRELLHTLAAQIAALDELISIARRSIRVFDIDLSQMGWNTVERADAVTEFLRRSPYVRLDMIMHDPRFLEGRCPRLQRLRHQYGHLMTFAQTGHEARGARDPLVIVDERHFLHRYDYEQPRATLAIEQPQLVTPLIDRFNEIWETRESTLPGTLLGI